MSTPKPMEHRKHLDRLEELRRRNAEAEEGGGAERRERQHKEGKLSARERIDLLLDEGIPVAFSEVEVSAALLDPGQPAAAFLGLDQPTAALMLTETMYLDGAGSAEGRPVQWSRNYFLPGKLSLRLVRDTPANRDPAIVLQLFADT